MYNKESLAKLKEMESLAPEMMKAFWAFDKAAIADGAIPAKHKELISVAVALTTQCRIALPSTAETHARQAQPMQKWRRPRWSPPPCEPVRPSLTRHTHCRITPTPPDKTLPC